MDDNTPFLIRHNARDSLKVLTNNLSLSKNMKTLLFAQHTHLGVMFETQSSLRVSTWYSWVILFTLEYAVHVICPTLRCTKIKNTEIGTALIHHVNGKLSWFSLVIKYLCLVIKCAKKCPNTPVIRSLIYSFIPPPPYYIYIINKFLKYNSINYHFFIYYKNIIFNARKYQRQLLKLHSDTK